MATRRAVVVALGLGLLCSCESPEDARTVSGLLLTDTVWSASNSLDSAQPWIGRVSDLLYLADSNSLLVLDGARKDAVELTIGGAIQHAYQPPVGEGPGELRSLDEIRATSDGVLLLDNRNRRILRFSVRGGLLGETPIKRNCAGFADLDGRIFCVPGSDSAAFDVYGLDGGYLGGRGRIADLPTASCPDHTCDRMPACNFCLLAATHSHTLLVGEATTPSLTEFDSTGAVIRAIQFDRYPFVREWRATAFDDIRSHASERPANAIETKRFIAALVPFTANSAALALLPPRELLRANGRELWLVQLESGEIQRFTYGPRNLGQRIAVTSDSTIYASDADGSVIVSLRFPPDT